MKYSINFMLLLALLPNTCDAYESPLESNVNCLIDLNSDDKNDIVLYVEKSQKKWDLIALLRNNAGYDAYVLTSSEVYLSLSCQNQKYIQETTAADGKGRLIKTNGAYIKLTQPESSSAGFYWDGTRFQVIQISD